MAPTAPTGLDFDIPPSDLRFFDALAVSPANRSRVYKKKADLPQPSLVADPDHPLFGEIVCFSGDLDSCTRSEAQVLAGGGQPVEIVTEQTFLEILAH